MFDISDKHASNFLGFGESCSSFALCISNNYKDDIQTKKQHRCDISINEEYSIRNITNSKFRFIYHNTFDVIIYNETKLNSSFTDNSELDYR